MAKLCPCCMQERPSHEFHYFPNVKTVKRLWDNPANLYQATVTYEKVGICFGCRHLGAIPILQYPGGLLCFNERTGGVVNNLEQKRFFTQTRIID